MRNYNPNILDGTKLQSVGPGEYNPTKPEMDKNVGVPKMAITNGLGTRKRNSHPTRGTGNYVGPGSYDPNFIIPNYKFKPSANFIASGKSSHIDHEIRKQIVMKQNPESDMEYDYVPVSMPGPGAYYNSKKNTSFGKKPKNYKFQLFIVHDKNIAFLL